MTAPLTLTEFNAMQAWSLHQLSLALEQSGSDTSKAGCIRNLALSTLLMGKSAALYTHYHQQLSSKINPVK
jgi:hypothetical protein